jgi:hypothetical protein
MNKNTINNVPADYLKECFRYENGKLYWKERPVEHFPSVRQHTDFTNHHAHKEAGFLETNNYRRVKFRYQGNVVRLNVHQIIAILHDFEVPPGYIVDHKNRNRLDNRVENLRVCCYIRNQQNRSLSYKNYSGYNGVEHNGFSWTAKITVNKKMIWLGSFPTKEEAVCKRLEAELEYFKEFSPNFASSIEGTYNV